jgi:hypothetical protein
MFICSNCKHFTTEVHTCEYCKKNVCKQCICEDDQKYPHHDLYVQLCSNCACANCVRNDELRKGYNHCKECDLQYCDDCFEETLCHEVKHVKN